jgi:hypothetical protein
VNDGEAGQSEEADMEASAASLYDRLGGIYSIATVVEDFIDRIMVRERLNAARASTRRTTACCRRG